MTQSTHSGTSVHMALENGNKEWKLAFGDGRHEREVTIPARDQTRLWKEIAATKTKFGLPADTPTFSCYEAGRDGFWIHRMLLQGGVQNIVVDPASIETNRRVRRVKTDRLDARKLRSMLIRHWVGGERKHWRVLHVPTAEEEAARRPHREAERLKNERLQHLVRIRSLLVLHGINPRTVRIAPELWKDWKGDELPKEVVAELSREQERLKAVDQQLKGLEQERRQKVKTPQTRAQQMAVKLQRIKAVGAETAWNLSHEFFGPRDFKNRREVGSAAGLTGCPYASVDSQREQGISKAGNARVRTWLIELSWRWLWMQPNSELSKWYQRRFGSGGKRQHRIGIVALARRLLIAMWRYLEWDILLEGAVARG